MTGNGSELDSGGRATRPPGRPRRRQPVAAIALTVVLAATTAVVGAAVVSGPAAAVGFFDDSERPTATVDPDTEPVELGVRFSVARAGTVVGVEFYRTPANRGPHLGSLWDSSGRRLATVRFPAGDSAGWVSADFDTPVLVRPGTTYVASYFAPNGGYSADERYFTRPESRGDVAVPSGAGVYRYGTAGGFPTSNHHDANYYVDVRFVPGAASRALDPQLPAQSGDASPTDGPSATDRPSATAGPAPTPLPTAPDSDATLDLPREPWHGGPSYYARFPKAAASGWDDPSFFPIAVFFGKPEHAAELASMGVNVYMGAEHDGSSIGSVTRHGISVLAQGEWTPEEVGDDPRVVGWHISDECEMGSSGCEGEEAQRLSRHRDYAERARALDDGRFIQANFGNGVLGTWWAPTTMDDHLSLVDVSSVDKYAYTSPHVQDLFRSTPAWPKHRDPASAYAYGWQQDRMETFTSPPAAKPNWVFVETARPYLTEDGATTITGEQIEGAVWNAIIHGASGIAYFQHNNDGECGNYSLVECSAALAATVTALNAEVASLAPVINTPSYVWSFGRGLDTSLRVHEGYAYIFAMTDGTTGSRTFTLPPGVEGTSVDVVGEDRRLTVRDGRFTDSFGAESAHHVYRIALG